MGGKTAIALGLVAGLVAGGLLVAGVVALVPVPGGAGAVATPQVQATPTVAPSVEASPSVEPSPTSEPPSSPVSPEPSGSASPGPSVSPAASGADRLARAVRLVGRDPGDRPADARAVWVNVMPRGLRAILPGVTVTP